MPPSTRFLTSTKVPSASICRRQGRPHRLSPRPTDWPRLTPAHGSHRTDAVPHRLHQQAISPAAAVLLLAQEHKLTLDDPVSKYLPDLTRANEVTIRMLLSHTSGYQD